MFFFKPFGWFLAFVKQLIFDRQSQDSFLSEHFDIKKWVLFSLFVFMVFVIFFLSKRLIIVTNLYMQVSQDIAEKEKAIGIREKVLNGQLDILYNHERKLNIVVAAMDENNRLIRARLLDPRKLSIMERQVYQLHHGIAVLQQDMNTIQKEQSDFHIHDLKKKSNK